MIDTYETKEDDTNLRQIETRCGNRLVISTLRGATWHSRLYVNAGETATLVTAKHKTETGARVWGINQAYRHHREGEIEP